MLDVGVSVGTPLEAGSIVAPVLLRNVVESLERSVAPASDCHHPSISNPLEVARVHPAQGLDCASAHMQKYAMCDIDFNLCYLAVEVLNLA